MNKHIKFIGRPANWYNQKVVAVEVNRNWYVLGKDYNHTWLCDDAIWPNEAEAKAAAKRANKVRANKVLETD